MISEKLKSENHANGLVSVFSNLYKSSLLYDVEINVESTVFKCHKLILLAQSAYFQERFISASVTSITISDVASEDFEKILGYLYRGEIELDSASVGRVLCASKLLQLDDLKDLCLRFLREKLVTETCVHHWEAAGGGGVYADLQRSCLDIFVKDFVQLTNSLNCIPRELMTKAVERDDLNIANEQELCDILLKWFSANIKNATGTELLLELASLIRWSSVSVDYVSSNLIVHEHFKSDQPCLAFLSRVMSYQLTRTQFPGLRTHYRPATGLEQCVVMFGTNTGLRTTRGCCRLSLQALNDVVEISDLPSKMRPGLNACVNKNHVYVTGLGFHGKKTWRWDSIGGWTRCGDMVEGRRRHFTTFTNSTFMYALGGYVDSTNTTLSSVEEFNTTKNKWKTVGQLAQLVDNAGGAPHKSSIYLFGGLRYDKSSNKNIHLDCIQEYDTTTEQCTVLTSRLPLALSHLRAVLWDDSVILMNSITCVLFNLDKNTVQHLDHLKVGSAQFALVVDNQTLFVIGGGEQVTNTRGRVRWSCTDAVKSVPVMDITGNSQNVTWTFHAKLRSPGIVHAWALMTLASR